MITRKAGPAWAVGCAGVIKPASRKPLSALALAVLDERAGLPPGVHNAVTGSARAIGRELPANPVVRKLPFTGSIEAGSLLLAQCAPTIKKASMELGGNAPFIGFDDTDIDAMVEGRTCRQVPQHRPSLCCCEPYAREIGCLRFGCEEARGCRRRTQGR